MSKIDELNERRAKLREAEAELETQQAEIDLAALVDAETELGFGSVRSLNFRGYRKGSPTLAIIRAPSRADYREYLLKVREAKNDRVKGEAAERLGESCMVYPPHKSESRTAMLEARPGVYVVAGIEAAKMAEASSEDAKKD
jgi:hypothetical protein